MNIREDKGEACDKAHFYLQLLPEAQVSWRRTRNLFYWVNIKEYFSGQDSDARIRLAQKLDIPEEEIGIVYV